jgi:peptidoglycan/LPS O-acetylase OafA/YrhL
MADICLISQQKTAEQRPVTSALRHRNDIDGLRAVAILPIVLFHAGISALAGGFVGVDIFFVISGFLITSIIVRELAEGRFRLVNFYRRRVVRIFPALFAMCAIVLVFGGWRLLPGEFARLADSTMAALAFASNIHFWLVSDYFAPEAELMPLLHTWSLGVEEQFYIFFPLGMIIVWRFLRGRFAWLLALAAVVSFAGGWVIALGSPVAAFYLLPVRAWELLAGGLVAVSGITHAARPGPRGREAVAAAGAALLLAGVVFVRDGAGFPMPQAAVPTLGAALVIACGERTAVGRVLSLGLLRYIGRISYSTYLWHWPLIAFWRIETGIALDPPETVGLVAASLAMGALSYHFVERPFMDRYRTRGSAWTVVCVGIGTLAAGVAATALVARTADSWRRIDPEVARIAAYADYTDRLEYQYQFRRGPCFRGEAQAQIPFRPSECVALSATRPNVVVVGDSYAAQFWRAIALRLPQDNVMQATASGCRPLVGSGGDLRCREVADYVLGPLLDSGRLSTVVLAGRWLPEDLKYLPATIARVKAGGATPVVIGPVPEYQGPFPSILARAIANHDMASIDRWRVPARVELDREMAALVQRAGGTYLSPIATLCPAGHCLLTTPERAPIQFDYGHLTLSGARWVVDRFAIPTAPAKAVSNGRDGATKD